VEILTLIVVKRRVQQSLVLCGSSGGKEGKGIRHTVPAVSMMAGGENKIKREEKIKNHNKKG